MSDLSRTSVLGIDVLHPHGVRIRVDSVGDVFDLSLKLLIEKGKADLPGLPEFHQVHVALEDISPNPEAIEGRDHEQGIVLVVEVARHNVALDHEPVDRGAQRHSGLL